MILPAHHETSGRPKTMVFCDFDGTITSEETFSGMGKALSPEAWARLGREIFNRRISLRDGVRQLVESIPTARYPEILAYIKTIPLRPGFAEFLDFLEQRGVPMVVVSGGLRCLVETGLGSLIGRVMSVYAPDLDLSEEHLKIECDFESDDEILDKTKIYDLYRPMQTILIGDSLTDLNLALKADLVFAREPLISHMKSHHRPYVAWNDFFDVIRRLRQSWDKDDD